MTQNLPHSLKISVVIPTCHRNDSLALCLDRLAPGVQTLAAENYEVIVSDDGSKSTAEAMMRERYPWAHWMAGPRRGPAANRNNGARRARADFIAFTDDDCLPTPPWLQSYANAIRSGASVYEGLTEANGPLRRPFVVAPINLNGGKLWSCNMMVAAQVFRELGGFDEGFPNAADEDTDFRERVLAAGYELHFVRDALIYHPPVRRVWGRKSARLWQSKVRLAYKANPNRQKYTRRTMIARALQTRLRQLWRSPWHFDKVLALPFLFVELVWIARHARSWDRKQRQSLNIAPMQPRPAAPHDNAAKESAI